MKREHIILKIDDGQFMGDGVRLVSEFPDARIFPTWDEAYTYLTSIRKCKMVDTDTSVQLKIVAVVDYDAGRV